MPAQGQTAPGSPRVTVVMPVYNRPDELRRALRSLQSQTYAAFECIVVDDCSSTSMAEVVAEFQDGRFRCIRNESNGGPYNARVAGYRRMSGEYLVQIDSDWEAYPWTIERMVTVLDEHPEVAAATGMHVRQHDRTQFVAVRAGRYVVTPDDYRKRPLTPDCIAAVRRVVVDEWLSKRTDYFAMEFHQWFTFGLQHSQIYVDEPWSRYHVDSANRVSTGFSERRLRDYRIFLEEHERLLRTVDADFIPGMLTDIWMQLSRAGHRTEADAYARILAARGTSVRRLAFRRVLGRVARKLGLSRASSDIFWV